MSCQNVSVFRREPTPQEITEASTRISLELREIDALQSQISTLQAQIHALKIQQANRVQIVNHHKGVTTLARRIPTELLADIFEHLVEYGWTRAPLVVSYVCSQWRLAAQTPKVWSRVYVNLDDADAMGRTRYWLRMACAAPLHITLLASVRTRHRQVLDAMALLLTRADQWSTFTFDITTIRHLQVALSRCIGIDSIPHLNAVTINMEMEMSVDPAIDGGVDEILLADVFTPERAPNLTSLRMDFTVLPAQMALPNQIRSLELIVQESPPERPLSAASLLNLIESLPGLTQLQISFPFIYAHPFVLETDSERSISLDNLKSMTLYGPTELNGFLAHLCAPSLLKLHLRSLEDIGYRQTPIGPSLLQFLQHSTLLEYLELYDIDMSPEYFASCFSVLGNLRELRLHESSISSGTLRLLNGPNGSDSGVNSAPDLRMCPKLTKLDLRWCGHLTGKSLVELVRSRLSSEQQPQTVTQHAMRFLHDADPAAPSPIVEIVVINCCFVEEQDVLNLARMTVCRVVIRESDYCYDQHCCDNHRYRQRLRFRHFMDLSPEQRSDFQLVV